MLRNPVQIASAIVVRIAITARINLVKRSVLPPVVSGGEFIWWHTRASIVCRSGCRLSKRRCGRARNGNRKDESEERLPHGLTPLGALESAPVSPKCQGTNPASHEERPVTIVIAH